MKMAVETKVIAGFWKSYQQTINESVIPYQWGALNDELEDTEPSHALQNFRIAAGLENGEYYGMVFQDSDVYKWLESVAYSLKNHPDKQLEQKADQVIQLIGHAQLADGYVNTYYQVKVGIDKRWTNIRDDHELYCAGHMIEAAVAYYETTQKDDFLQIAIKFADYIAEVFGEEEGQIKGYPGHQEIELALVRLYVVTNNSTYLKLATFFVEERGKEPNFFNVEAEQQGRPSQSWWHGNHEYSQAHLPIRQQTEAKGHAVRALYYYAAVADLARLNQDETLADTVRVLWENIINHKMYINGGVGASAWGEAFAENDDLPNDTMYNETCASIALAFFAKRMLELEKDGAYADVLENAIYNGSLGGMDVEGKSFLYVNPLEINRENQRKRRDHGHVATERRKWFGCACCPPNLARLIGSIGHYFAHIYQGELFIDMYGTSETKVDLDGQSVILHQETNYPFAGTIKMTIETEQPVNHTIHLRIPAWSEQTTIKVNGKTLDIHVEKGYVTLQRQWIQDDVIELTFDMTPRRVFSYGKITDNIGKVAFTRGPFVYVAEEKDNGAHLGRIWVKEGDIQSFSNDDVLPDTMYLKVPGKKLVSTNTATYTYEKPIFEQAEIILVPYFMWGNRGYGEIRVWLNEYHF